MKLYRLPLISNCTDLRGKKVIVRAALDVPLNDEGDVVNYFRIMRAMPTLVHLRHFGAKIIILTHIGRDPKTSLEPLYRILRDHLPCTFVPNVIGGEVERSIGALGEGEAVLLENVRSHEGEVLGDEMLAKKLASYADIYVNDAFSVSHREHASIVGIPKYLPSYVGLTFYEEYMRLFKTITPELPALFLLGGAKFDTKLSLVEKYLETYNNVYVGGALANDFFKAMGYEVGHSVVSDSLKKDDAILTHKKILLPVDVTVDGPDGVRTAAPKDVTPEERILDAGPETVRMLGGYIEKAKTILWNGPLGYYEEGYVDATKECAKLIAAGRAYSVVGGGDTIASIESLAINDQFSFISTAGGAMLRFLEDGTLPGIDAVMKSSRS